MAAQTETSKIFARNKIQMFDHDPGATTAVLCSGDGGTTINYQDMRDFENFAAIAMLSLKAGNGITKLEIVASAATTFSAVTVIKDSGTVAADAVGDFVCLECSAKEIAQAATDAGVDLRYVAARLTCQNAGDEAVVTYIASSPRFAYEDLTANVIA